MTSYSPDALAEVRQLKETSALASSLAGQFFEPETYLSSIRPNGRRMPQMTRDFSDLIIAVTEERVLDLRQN